MQEHSASCLCIRLQQVKYSTQGNMPIAVLRMVHACMNGIPQYHTWNMPVSCMEYTCIMHGICLKHASFMHEICVFFMHETCMKFRHQSMHETCMSHTWKTSQIPACYMHISGIVHITCMKFQTIQYCYRKFHRGGAAGPAGPVLAGPLFGRIIINFIHRVSPQLKRPGGA